MSATISYRAAGIRFLIGLFLATGLVMVLCISGARALGNWLPDGGLLEFRGIGQRTGTIYVYDIAHNLRYPLITNGLLLDARYRSRSPDGRYYTFQTYNSAQGQSVYVLDLFRRSILHLMTDSEITQYNGFAWSSDSTQVAFDVLRGINTREIYILDIPNMLLRAVDTRDSLNLIATLHWSADASSIYVIDFYLDSVYRVDVADARLNRAFSAQDVPYAVVAPYAPVWSPDGSRLAFTGSVDGAVDIYVLDMTTGTLENITRHPEADWNAVWSPDGSQLAFLSDRDGEPHLVVLDLERGEMRPVGVMGDVAYQWSAGGSYLWTYNAPARQMTIVNINGGHVQTLAFPDAPPGHIPQWSPDDERLLYLARDSSQTVIRIYTLATGTTQIIDACPQLCSDLRWLTIESLIDP